MTADKRSAADKWPSSERWADRLAHAQAEGLLIVSERDLHGHALVPTLFAVTPSDPLNIVPYWVCFIIDYYAKRNYITCTCAAGEHGIPCKHMALVVTGEGPDYPVRVLDFDEWKRFDDVGELPEDGPPDDND